MKLNKEKRIGLLILFIILLAVLIAVLLFMGKTFSKKEKIGFIMTGSIGEEGWNGMHYKGVSAACTDLDVELLVRENVENVVFDFEDTRFMDSSGIGIIMGRYRKISCFGGHVYAIHTDRQIQRIFRMSGLHKIVEILPG